MRDTENANMFQIESIDDPTWGFRVMILKTAFRSVVRIQQRQGDRFITQAERDFRCHQSAAIAYDTQIRLLTCCAKSRGDNYRIRENERVIEDSQLTLEIAA